MVDSIITGEPQGYAAAATNAPISRLKSGDLKVAQLEQELADVKDENAALKNRIQELELKLAQLQGTPTPRQIINSARLTDKIVNGES